MPNVPVLLLMETAPAEEKLMPAVPLAGAIAWVRLLTSRVVTAVGGADGNPGGLIAAAGLDGAAAGWRAEIRPCQRRATERQRQRAGGDRAQKRIPGRPAAATPLGQVHKFVIEIPTV